MGLQAVIFDFDGVIADDERIHMAGFQHALAAHEIDLSEAAYFARYVGLDDRDGFRAMLRDAGRDPGSEELAEMMRTKEQRFRELVRERVKIFPGVRELLTGLRDGQAGLPTAIGSGALSSEIRLVLDIAGLSSFFDEIVAADDVSCGKPDPELFLTACERLARQRPEVTPQGCLVIEDSPSGLRAARAAGMSTVAVTNSFPRESLEADLVIGSLEELDRARCEALLESQKD